MDDLEIYLAVRISAFGYPVGMGIAPPPETVDAMASEIRKIVATELLEYDYTRDPINQALMLIVTFTLL